jgi:hypothetical protein
MPASRSRFKMAFKKDSKRKEISKRKGQSSKGSIRKFSRYPRGSRHKACKILLFELNGM